MIVTSTHHQRKLAIRQNNLAVASFITSSAASRMNDSNNTKTFDRAIRRLVGALESYKKSTIIDEKEKEANGQQQQEEEEEIMGNCCSSSIQASLDRYLMNVLKKKTIVFNNDDKTNDQYLFTRFISIPPSTAFSTKASSMIPTIIIFNLALVHHLHGRKITTSNNNPSSGGSSSILRKAASLYELSYGLLKEQSEEEVGNLGFASNKLFVLAVVNNLGVLHWELNDGKKATKCFEFVMSVLVLMSNNVDDDDEYRVDNNNIDGLLSNATRIVLKLATAAAAA